MLQAKKGEGRDWDLLKVGGLQKHRDEEGLHEIMKGVP